jgi:transcriptional regulator with XRE-family HTH domain
MTPFGKKVRSLRRERGITQAKMAEDLAVSAAYLSALEHGHRGRPGPGFILQIADYFDLIWDEAEDLKRLAALSHPRVVVDTSGLSPKATELANLLAEAIQDMDEDTLDWILDEIKSRQMHKARTGRGGGGPAY